MLAELTRRYRRVCPVFIRHGLLWESDELRALRRFLRAIDAPRHPSPALTVLSLPVADLYGSHWSLDGRHPPGAATPDQAVYLPGRNLLMLSKAAAFCAARDIDLIALGCLARNPFADATPEFFREFARLAGRALGRRFRIIVPYRSRTKAQVVRRGDRLGLPLRLSFSCLAPRRGRHCGQCNKCAERQRAFARANVSDPTRYAG